MASIGKSFRSFFHAVDQFFSNLAHVHWGSLLLGLAAFVIYLSFRARASFHILRAAYPTEAFRFRDIWGAYFAGYGFNSVIPARGGDVVRLFLTKTSVPRASYPAVGATFVVEAGFDLVMGVFILGFAFTQGVFPKPPAFAKLNAFDLSYLASHPKFTLFLLTALGVGALVAFALLSVRLRAFWARVRQGFTIAYDRRRYMREVFAVQFVGWLFRFTAFWMLLEAFNIGGSVKNVLLVLGVNAVCAAVPSPPREPGSRRRCWSRCLRAPRPGPPLRPTRLGSRSRSEHSRSRSGSPHCSSSSACAASRRSSLAARPTGPPRSGRAIAPRRRRTPSRRRRPGQARRRRPDCAPGSRAGRRRSARTGDRRRSRSGRSGSG